MSTSRKELPAERFVAEDVTEAIWLRFRRLSSEQLCRQIITRNHSSLTPDVIGVKAAGMSSAVRSALGYWETQQGGLNSKILSRYYAILQITIAEQIASSNPAENLSTAQKHTENGHGLYTFNVTGNSFLEDCYVGCLKSGHFPAYQRTLGHDISAYATDRRPRKIEDADMGKVISLCDLIRRVPEFQETVKEYTGNDPLSFHIGHASIKNMTIRSQRMKLHAERTGQVLLDPPLEQENVTTYVAFYPHGSSVSAEELNGYGFEITNIVAEAAATQFDSDCFVGEIDHPKDTYWWQYVESYKSGYCGTSVIVPFWGMKDAFVLHLTILYAFSIVVRYQPETWHEIEHGKLNHIRALLEHYLVILDNVLPKLAVERLTLTRLIVSQPGGLSAPV